MLGVSSSTVKESPQGWIYSTSEKVCFFSVFSRNGKSLLRTKKHFPFMKKYPTGGI